MKRFPFLLLLFAVVAAGQCLAADSLPNDVSGEAWFAHCARLSAERVTHYPDVTSHRITYAWETDIGYRWDWENGNRASGSNHYCVRVALYGKRARLIENVTLLCSVNDRGKPTEVWTFGNFEVAVNLCRLSSEALTQIDARAAKP